MFQSPGKPTRPTFQTHTHPASNKVKRYVFSGTRCLSHNTTACYEVTHCTCYATTCLCCTPVPHSPSGRIRIGRNPKGSTDQVQKFKRELRRPMRSATYINVNIERKRGNERIRHEGQVPESYIRSIYSGGARRTTGLRKTQQPIRSYNSTRSGCY